MTCCVNSLPHHIVISYFQVIVEEWNWKKCHDPSLFVMHKQPYILCENSLNVMLLNQWCFPPMQQNPEPEHLHPVGVRFFLMTPVLGPHLWPTRTTIVQNIIWLMHQQEVKSLEWATSLLIQWPVLPWCMAHHLPIKARILWTKRWDAMFNNEVERIDPTVDVNHDFIFLPTCHLLQINRFMSVNKLKYFFAVDTKYVVKKLLLLMFPYTHQVKYSFLNQRGNVYQHYFLILITIASLLDFFNSKYLICIKYSIKS